MWEIKSCKYYKYHFEVYTSQIYQKMQLKLEVTLTFKTVFPSSKNFVTECTTFTI